MRFYNRETELDRIKKLEGLSRENLFFIRVTGRRRIGKTLLMREYLKRTGGSSLYFFVTKKKEKLLLEEYAQVVAQQYPQYAGTGFKDFDHFFMFLFSLLKREKIMVVFDEFQNFKYVNEAIFSILQKHIDLNKSESHGLLLVIGSINSMMRRIFENRDQPLYGRLNGSFLLKNFSLSTIREILTDHGVGEPFNENLLFYYSLFEGIPFYYNYISERAGFGKSRLELLKEDILDESSILLNEGKEILLEEFGKDYSTYFSILEAIAGGATTVSRIGDVSGISVGSLSRYLSDLMEDHELVERIAPFDAKNNNKMGRYYIRDNFLDFWFRYIFKNKSKIEIMSPERLASEMLEDFPVFMGKKFEKLMMTHLIEQNRAGKIRFDRIGSYWDRGETEIDVVYTDEREKRIVFGECKLSAKRFNRSSLEEKVKRFLKSNPKYIDWGKKLEYFAPQHAGHPQDT